MVKKVKQVNKSMCICTVVLHLMWSFHPPGGALAEGFQERLKEFQSFERRFEVCVCVCVSALPTSSDKVILT